METGIYIIHGKINNIYTFMKIEKGRIISAFPGMGKSYIAQNYKNWVDLESTPFQKNWKLYADVANHMSSNGYNVMVSTHKEMRDELKLRSADFTLAMPSRNLKQEYIRRYKYRGNDYSFVYMMSGNWDKFIDDLVSESDVTKIISCKPDMYLSDIIIHDK